MAEFTDSGNPGICTIKPALEVRLDTFELIGLIDIDAIRGTRCTVILDEDREPARVPGPYVERRPLRTADLVLMHFCPDHSKPSLVYPVWMAPIEALRAVERLPTFRRWEEPAWVCRWGTMVGLHQLLMEIVGLSRREPL